MMRVAKRRGFYVTYFCGHDVWTSLPDGPGWLAGSRQVASEAATGYCPACRKMQERVAGEMERRLAAE